MTDKEALKKMYQLLLTEPHAPTVCAQLEAIAREALAQPEHEPVAWMHIQGNYQESSFRQLDDWEIKNGFKQYPLYATPPQRTEPICPECKAEVLYECVACSSNNYPPQRTEQEPEVDLRTRWPMNGWKENKSTPPQRKPLTAEVITRIGMTHQGLHQVARAIEAAHDIKENT